MSSAASSSCRLCAFWRLPSLRLAGELRPDSSIDPRAIGAEASTRSPERSGVLGSEGRSEVLMAASSEASEGRRGEAGEALERMLCNGGGQLLGAPRLLWRRFSAAGALLLLLLAGAALFARRCSLSICCLITVQTTGVHGRM